MTTEKDIPEASKDLLREVLGGSTRGKVAPDQPAAEAKPEPEEQGYEADPEFQIRGAFTNPMLDASMPLVGLMMRLRTLDTAPNIERMQAQVRTQVDTILEEMRQRNYEASQLLSYSYALCVYLDETVMSTPWGRNCSWSQKPLLSHYHQEAFGGEKYFTILSRLMQEPERYLDVLEFMYVCLCMGLRGKYKLQPGGNDVVEALIVKLQRIVCELHGPIPEQWSDPLSNIAPRHFRMKRQWPWWSPLVASALGLVAIYAYYSYRLSLITAEVLQSLDAILQ